MIQENPFSRLKIIQLVSILNVIFFKERAASCRGVVVRARDAGGRARQQRRAGAALRGGARLPRLRASADRHHA